ncbi:MAG: Crp/Fnr family transcriptional regulator [Ktedonobacteraceae bacterium]
MSETAQPRNLLLRKLPEHQLAYILAVAEFVHVDLREPIIEPYKPMGFVDFPESGVISIVTQLDNGRMIEIANIGNEGFVGIPIFLKVEAVPEKAFCQVQATAWRIKASDFKKLVTEVPELTTLCEKYLATFLNQIARNSGCNWTHSIEERCARWLLLTHDRVDGDEFTLTQEFLAMMLGVTRGGVNLAAGTLAKAGLISYVRGKITVLDRQGLEDVTCECYNAMRKYFNQTFDL